MPIFPSTFVILHLNTTMLWLLLLLLGPVCLIVYLLHKHNIVRQLWLSADLPGPRAYPLIGNGLLFLNKTAIGA